MWIIKVGGSLQDSAYLQPWLDAIVMHGAGRLVVVPGGGRFADAVREAQRRFGFDDSEAHRRAVLAMEEYAAVLHERAPRLIPAHTAGEIRAVLKDGGVPLWLPYSMVSGNAALPAGWEVTSDSLALWLAQELGLAGLILVKSLAVDGERPLEDLAASGVIDGHFPQLFTKQPVRLAWYAAEDAARLPELLD